MAEESIKSADLHIEFPNVDYTVRGIYFIILNQLLSYYKAIKRGINPDQPEGLDAWINLN